MKAKPRNSRPWIIWVEDLHPVRSLYLIVYRPKHDHFLWWGSRRRQTLLVHEEGPIYYDSPRRQMTISEELIAIAKEHIPDGQHFQVGLDLHEIQEIVAETWLR
jgi:hypothetical protein